MKLPSCFVRTLTCIAVMASVHAAPAQSEEAFTSASSTCDKAITLDEFRALGFEKSPLFAEINREYAEQIARAFQTEVLPNPDIQLDQSYTSMSIGGANDPQANVSIGQPFRLSHLGAREKVARLLREVGDRQRRAQFLAMHQQFSVQFYSLFALQETARILSDAEKWSTTRISLIREGVKKGLLSNGDELLFEGEKARLQAQQKGLLASVARLHHDISQTLGTTCLLRITAERVVPATPATSILLEMAEKSDLSETTRRDLLAQVATEELRLAELDANPQITPRLVYQHTNDGGDFFGVGISIPLPMWDRNQAEQIRKRGDLEISERKQRFLRDGGFAVQIQLLRESAEQLKAQAEIYSSQVVPSFTAALKAQERQFDQGKGNVLQVWQTRRIVTDMELQALKLWLEAVTTRGQLSLSIGEEL